MPKFEVYFSNLFSQDHSNFLYVIIDVLYRIKKCIQFILQCFVTVFFYGQSEHLKKKADDWSWRFRQFGLSETQNTKRLLFWRYVALVGSRFKQFY